MAQGLINPKQERSRQKLDRLLAAGEKLFGERGYEAARIADIAREAGCALGTFYQRFPNKDVLLHELTRRFVDRSRASFTANLTRITSLPPRERPRAVISGIVGGLRASEGFFRAVVNRAVSDPELMQSLRAMAQTNRSMTISVFSDSMALFGHPQPELGLTLFFQFMYGALVNQVRNSPGPLSLHDDRIIDELVRMFDGYMEFRA